MLADIFPRFHDRYRALPIFGATVDGFVSWLCARGYCRVAVRRHARGLARMARAFARAGYRAVGEVTRENLHRCAREHSRDDVQVAATARALACYLDERGILPIVDRSGPIERKLAEYEGYLAEVRGLSPATIAGHVVTLKTFLRHLRYETRPASLRMLEAREVEIFVRALGERLSRATLQHAVAHLRSFLRFLTGRGETAVGLDAQIDTPRVYRQEQLPRALPWSTVEAFLRAIDRRTPLGRRDYAMFLLMTRYGLRSCEVAALTLDDVDWRRGRLRVPQPKTGTPLLLPLVDEVGTALVDYLRRGRPSLPEREFFLRGRAPAGCLRRTAVTDAFQAWVRRSGLDIPFQGPHCLRHSYAVHLLRQGVSLKRIGDVLGHRNAESTCMYLRLAVDDLRDVALALPRRDTAEGRR